MRTLGNNSFVVAAGASLRDGELDRVQQILIANGFGQERERAQPSWRESTSDICVATDKDNRHAQICLG
jgi:hypothetical protein